ncbi:MAG: hypothetical protein HY399_02035 [Elusimicrobia bacterium]|nr:hypothetical protein [Elusimicrobiota bacterium]
MNIPFILPFLLWSAAFAQDRSSQPFILNGEEKFIAGFLRKAPPEETLYLDGKPIFDYFLGGAIHVLQKPKEFKNLIGQRVFLLGYRKRYFTNQLKTYKKDIPPYQTDFPVFEATAIYPLKKDWGENMLKIDSPNRIPFDGSRITIHITNPMPFTIPQGRLKVHMEVPGRFFLFKNWESDEFPDPQAREFSLGLAIQESKSFELNLLRFTRASEKDTFREILHSPLKIKVEFLGYSKSSSKLMPLFASQEILYRIPTYWQKQDAQTHQQSPQPF